MALHTVIGSVLAAIVGLCSGYWIGYKDGLYCCHSWARKYMRELKSHEPKVHHTIRRKHHAAR